MTERSIITCDGCSKEMPAQPQPMVTMFIDNRTRTMGKPGPNGNYHCCSLACLLTFATHASKVAP